MSKFNRKTQQLKARVQFLRGRLSKQKGDVLTDDETDNLSDAEVQEMRDQDTLEVVDREPAEGEASQPDGGATGGDKPAGGKGAK